MVPPTITAVSAWNRYGSPAVRLPPPLPASSTPTNVASSALTTKPAVQVRPVRTSARRAATGLVPVRYRLRPALVLASTIPAATANSSQMTTTGGTGRPNVSLITDTAVEVQAGGVPVTAPPVQPVSTPASSEPT